MVTIRFMGDDDVLAVAELLGKTYRWLGQREAFTAEQVEFLVSKRGSLECVSRESRNQLYFVASVRGDIVGMVAVSGNEITKLYVLPAHHRTGIGTELFAAAEAVVRGAGYDRLTLGAFRTAVPFYAAMGMSVTGRKPHGRGPLEGLSVTLMEKELKQGEG